MAVLDPTMCSICKGEMISIGMKRKVKLDLVFICPNCDPHLVKTALERRKIEES